MHPNEGKHPNEIEILIPDIHLQLKPKKNQAWQEINRETKAKLTREHGS